MSYRKMINTGKLLLKVTFRGRKPEKNNCQNLQSKGDNSEIIDYRLVKVTTELGKIKERNSIVTEIFVFSTINVYVIRN
jgi:hypothetical protein